jgi:chemotaxis protein MotB
MSPRPGHTAPIVIKRKKVAPHGHHGGAWKVAYADFVTAMMAFFLLLWLLNVTTQQQKQAIANYFDPTSASESTSGSGGLMGGQTMAAPGAKVSEATPIGENIPLPGDPAQGANDDKTKPPSDTDPFAAQEKAIQDKNKTAADAQKVADQAKVAAQAKVEDANFKQAESSIRQAIQSVPELQQMSQNLLVDETPEGLRIQLVDQDGSAMFASGGTEMPERTKKLLAVVAHAIANMPNQVTIRGHTDATQYRSEKGYSNWDLSTDRANASRRVLVESGLDQTRVASVVGKADREPLFPENPNAPENRRISIVLLRASAASAGNSDAAIAPSSMGHIKQAPD